MIFLALPSSLMYYFTVLVKRLFKKWLIIQWTFFFIFFPKKFFKTEENNLIKYKIKFLDSPNHKFKVCCVASRNQRVTKTT
jgi:hypothetical protein